MGKPFSEELKLNREVLRWVANLDLGDLEEVIKKCNNQTIYIIGSGGSLSACYFLEFLFEQIGVVAKSVTPLEVIYSKNNFSKSHFFLISSSGKNKDILFAFKKIVKYNPRGVSSICMVKNSPLKRLSEDYTKTNVFEYNIPSGKDGFLATNTLLSYFGIFTKIFGNLNGFKSLEKTAKFFLNDVEAFAKKIDASYTLFVLYSGSSKCVAMDIESKCIEASLCDLTIADYRNFGHGRHNWFDKRGNSTGVVLLTNNLDRSLAKKTIDALPKNIPFISIDSDNEVPLSSLDQLLQSFQLIKALGLNAGIDPGRPGVPEFGRKLYNLSYYNIFKEKTSISSRAYNSIYRKVGATHIKNPDFFKLWNSHYNKFINKINSALFTAIVFDFDGTLCSSSKRFEGVDSRIRTKMVSILESGFLIGVATGRGKSARENLQEFIPKKYYKNVFISYYNGFETGHLGQNELPNLSQTEQIPISKSYKILQTKLLNYDVNLELRPGQLTVEISERNISTKLKSFIRGIILKHKELDVQILESDHSMDIIPKTVSKLSILDFLGSRENELGLNGNYLCIGDKGVWPGNDYKLLSSQYSLSVDETSLDENSCWNLASLGLYNEEATIEYLEKIQFSNGFMKFKINK